VNIFSRILGRAASEQQRDTALLQPEPVVHLPPSWAPEPEGDELHLPQFRATSGALPARDRSLEQDRARELVRSAFTPAQPISSAKRLAGRREILTAMIRAIEDQQAHVVLFGERGIGKTSLLHAMADLSRRARYLVRYVSCSEEATFSEVFRSVLEEIPLLHHAGFDPASEEVEAGGTFGDLLPDGLLTSAQVTDHLSSVTNAQVLIMLDEFDRAENAQFRRQTTELMKSLSDRAASVQLVIAGVAGNLTELVGYIPSVRRNIVALPVEPMPANDVSDLIHIGETISKIPFAQGAMELVVRTSRGLPYVASLLAHHASLAAIERGASTVEEADVLDAVGRAVAHVEVQISAQCRFSIEHQIAKGGSFQLQTLARSAFDGGGRIEFGVSESLADVGSDTEASALDLGRLIEPIPGDPEGAYRFKEEGVPVYLWLRHVASDRPFDGSSGVTLEHSES